MRMDLGRGLGIHLQKPSIKFLFGPLLQLFAELFSARILRLKLIVIQRGRKNVKKFMRSWNRMIASRGGVTVLIWLNMI